MIYSSIRKGSVERSWCFPLFGQEVQFFFLFQWNTMDTAINEQAQSLVWCTWEQTKYFSLYSIYNDKCFLFPVTCRECQQSCSCYLKEKMSKNVTVFSRRGEKTHPKTNENHNAWTISSNLRLVKLVSCTARGVVSFPPVLLKDKAWSRTEVAWRTEFQRLEDVLLGYWTMAMFTWNVHVSSFCFGYVNVNSLWVVVEIGCNWNTKKCYWRKKLDWKWGSSMKT